MAESNPTQVILTDDGIKIIKAQNTADNASGGVTNLNDPNLMSVIEKQNNIGRFAGLTSQYNVLVQNAKDDGIDTTAVTTAYNNLNRFMADILADPDHASDIDRVIYKKYQDAYNEELVNLQRALQNNTNNKFTSAANATSQAASTASQAFVQAQSAVDYANSETAVQSAAIDKAQSAASNAVSKAESTASEFGRVDQKAGSALTSALNAQGAASDAVSQASSAAADSKDAKQIAGAVSQSYKTLTDGSTMTIAELENGLATKLTKTDLDGYATQSWTQNQIKVTSDGINATLSSVKSTVDGHTASINDLQADSNSFKSQFTTVNNTLGKQTTDVGTLQATSKELTTGFNTLTSDNTTNKNDISQLKLTSTELSSTMETVQTQVQNSAVGTNLLTNTDKDISITSHTTDGWPGWVSIDTGFSFEHGKTYTFSAEAKNSTDKIAEASIRVWESSTNTQVGVYAFPADGERHSVTLTIPNDSHNYHLLLYAGHAGIVPGVDVTTTYHHPKLEKGSIATDWCLNPAETATVTDVSTLSKTVDDIKIDMSKKIEQKDLNGYATQTWTQNQIKTTADGINGTMSSIKGTVDSHTTNINDLKADSSSFKSQFTTVNNTIGKHTTDISTLQASAKSLSASFDSLNSDNQTSQHNISQLQASAKTFNSTLTTVQTQVQNSAVGTNLLTNTDKDISITSHTTDGWPGWVSIDTGFSFEHGKTYTFSAEAKNSTDKIAEASIRVYDFSTNTDIGIYVFPADGERHSITFTIPNNSLDYQLLLYAGHAGIVPGVDVTTTYHHPKLEKGSLATDWCLNPTETATQSQITQLSNDINLRVTKGDLISQINLQARNTLISSGGQLTLSGKNVFIDSNDPVIMKSANIDKLLVGKKLTAADISANTFTTNNGTFTVKQDGSVTAKNMTLTGGTLTSPTINASKINSATINGTTFNGGSRINNPNNTAGYYPMTITPDGTYKSTYFDNAVGLQSSVESGAIEYKYRSMIGNGQYVSYNSVIDGQGFHSQSGYTSAKDSTFSRPQTITGYVDVTPATGIYLYGPTQQINFAGRSDNMGSDGITMDAYGNIYGQSNSAWWRIGDVNGNQIINFGIDKAGSNYTEFKRNIQIGNIGINTAHSITMQDGKGLYINSGKGGRADLNVASLNYQGSVSKSLLSEKRDVKKVNTAYWAQLVNSIDLATYQYKDDDNTSNLRLSGIVDDVNTNKQWQLPDVFVARDEDGKLAGIENIVLQNAMLATIQEQQKEIDKLNGHLLELEAKLNG